jgi:hypothetical protein
MLGFDSLLKYADDNHRAVIVSLVGVLIAGGVGGGFFIQTLQSTIAQRDALEKQHLDNITSAYAIEKGTFKSQLNALAIRADVFESHSTIEDEVIEKDIRELRDLGRSTKPVPKSRLVGIAEDLDNSHRMADQALRDMKRTLENSARIINSPPTSARYEPVSPVFLLLVLIFIFTIPAAAVAYLLRRRRRRLKLALGYGRTADEKSIIVRARRDFDGGRTAALIAHQFNVEGILLNGMRRRWTPEIIKDIIRVK